MSVYLENLEMGQWPAARARTREPLPVQLFPKHWSLAPTLRTLILAPSHLTQAKEHKGLHHQHSKATVRSHFTRACKQGT